MTFTDQPDEPYTAVPRYVIPGIMPFAPPSSIASALDSLFLPTTEKEAWESDVIVQEYREYE